MNGFASEELITAASADETTSQWVNVRGRTCISFYLTGTGTTSSGVITLEETMPNKQNVFPATPSVITTVNASAITAGAEVAVHVSPVSYSHVRARISTVIGGGGTVTVGLVAV